MGFNVLGRRDHYNGLSKKASSMHKNSFCKKFKTFLSLTGSEKTFIIRPTASSFKDVNQDVNLPKQFNLIVGLFLKNKLFVEWESRPVWPNGEITSTPIFSKSCPKHQFLHKKWCFENSSKICQIMCPHLKENLYKRTFKNRPSVTLKSCRRASCHL